MASRTSAPYNYFDKYNGYHATSAVFSPAGDILYVATIPNYVFAIDSTAGSFHWVIDAQNSDLCDIAVTPDGLSVRANSVLVWSVKPDTLIE